jgi:coproporphyrinogen III oxidase-like Fe-S oxidoreductase
MHSTAREAGHGFVAFFIIRPIGSPALDLQSDGWTAVYESRHSGKLPIARTEAVQFLKSCQVRPWLPDKAWPKAIERPSMRTNACFDTAVDVLVEAGYQQIGLDHFARSDDLLIARQAECRLHRNFQGCTADEAPILLGIGASAISSLPQGYAQNAASMITYRNALVSNRLATARGRARTDEDRLRGFIIERLMCDLHVDLGKACKAHGAP